MKREYTGREMYYVLSIIMNSNGAITSMDIQKQLKEEGIDLTIKMIYQRIDFLNDFFEPIFHHKIIRSIKKKGFIFDEDYLDDGQLQLLLDSIIYHKDLGSEDKNALIEKMLAFSSENQKRRLILNESSEQKLSFSLFLNLSTLIKAIDRQKMISFGYVNYEYENHHFKEVAKDHQCSPYQIVLNDNHYYLISYDDSKKDVSGKEGFTNYRVDRMRNILINKQDMIDIRSQFDMNKEIEGMGKMNMFPGSEKIDLTIQFHKSITREIISQFGLELDIEEKQLGWYETTIKDIELTGGLKGWLFMLQKNIRVIGPYQLKEEMKEIIKAIDELYK